jgi:oligopeptidase A
MTNPLLDLTGLPRFDLIKPEHVAPALDVLIPATEAAIAAAETAPATWDGVVKPLDDAGEKLWRAWGFVGHLQAVTNTPEWRAAYQAELPRITRLASAWGQNTALLEQYRAIAASPEFAGYDATRKRIIETELRDARLSGAELEGEARERFAAISEELAGLQARFADNVLDATDGYVLDVTDAAQVEGIPEDVLAACAAAAEAAGVTGWRLGLKQPVLIPVLTYAKDRALRETLYLANAGRASELGPEAQDNTGLMTQILKLRGEQAALLGFASYGDYSLATKMATDSEEAIGFLRDMAGRAMPHAKRDRADLEAFAAAELGIDELKPWDIGFAGEVLKQQRYSVSQQQVKAYFTFPKVLDGLFGLIGDLYGLSIEAVEAPVWHEDVRFFQVVNREKRTIGHFYLDAYAREGKRGGAWMDGARDRRATVAGLQTPLVYLVCNFGKPAAGKVATLSHDDVITLFHEMGHGLHQLLTEVDEMRVGGINGVEWDAVELPSQFMENFAWEWARVSAMTAHVDTGEALPRALFDQMLKARNFQSGMRTMRQVEFSLLDMMLHHGFDAEGDQVLALLTRIRKDTAVNPASPFDRFPNQFSHIFAGGYAAGYYSYKWAEVLSADAYAAFEEAPDQFAAIGEKFRKEVLSRGGSRPANENFEAFRERAPDIAPLLRHSGLG